MRQTLLRLERDRAEDATQALQFLQRHFEDLANALIEAGRQRGYLGGDPMGALAHLTSPAPEELQVARQIADLWRTFFAGFREDEANFEAARFNTEAAEINRRLEELPVGQTPPLGLAMEMLDALLVFWEERQESVSERIDHLINDLTQHQAKLGSADLERAHQADELERATKLVATAVVDLGEDTAHCESLTDLLGVLVKRWRHELQDRKQQIDKLRHSQALFLRALALAATGKVPEDIELDDSTARVVEEVADMVAGYREQEQAIRDFQQERSRLAAELQDAQHEIANRDELIARYEFDQNKDVSEDDRLALYRRAFAMYEAGEDPRAVLAEVQELERVFLYSFEERSRVMELIDRHVDGLTKTLLHLRKVLPLSEDPRRYRPRLLKASPYQLKTLPGILQAGRDAGRDLVVYVGRARWAAGALFLSKQFPRLRRIFKEMVRFIGDCRDKLGGPAPASCTMDIATLDGLAALPAVLAVDVKALAAARGARSMAGQVVDLLEECVSLLHELLQKAKGITIDRSVAPAREAANKALVRLADELMELTGIMETTFAEARANDWQPASEEQSLVENEHLMLLGLRDLDAIADAVAGINGAPDPGFSKLPSGRRSDLDRLLLCLRERVAYLEDTSRYRTELTPKE